MKHAPPESGAGSPVRGRGRRVCAPCRSAGLFRCRQHALGIGEVQRHRDFDLDVLAFRQRQYRLVRVLVARRGQNDGVHARAVDAGFEAGRMKRDLPLVGERFPRFFGPAGDRHHFDAGNLPKRLHVYDAHGAGAASAIFILRFFVGKLRIRGVSQTTNLLTYQPHRNSRSPVIPRPSASGCDGQIRTSSTEKPASSRCCANDEPSARWAWMV